MYEKGKEPRSMMTQRGFHGSPKESHKNGPGEVAGSKEIGYASALPGKMAMKTKPHLAGLPFEGGRTSGKSKGIKKYSEE